MKSFEPIAIVGIGCIFPNAFNPAALWQGLMDHKSFLTDADEDTFRTQRIWAETDDEGTRWPVNGGYIRNFQSIADPAFMGFHPESFRKLDPLIQWSMSAAHQALTAVQHKDLAPDRKGLILGNLSLPSRTFSQFAESVWIREAGEYLAEMAIAKDSNPLQRMMSGYPAHFIADSMQFKGKAFALDAACASSLYAIKLACDQLQQGEADLMLAGAVNGTDPLFLHTGFRALKALSPTGQSRPFHAQADGLVPAEGSGFVSQIGRAHV